MKKSTLVVCCMILFVAVFAAAQDFNARDEANVPASGNAVATKPLGDGSQSHLGSVLSLLYDNGPMVTHPGGGSGGADASALQNTVLNSYGANQSAATFRIADDFTVSGGPWTIDSIVFFGYQTGSTTTSTFTGVHLQIWNGPPGESGSSIVFGDLTTNRMTSTRWSHIYRVLITTLTDINRPIMRNVVQVGTTLGLGTYWLDWNATGSLASGPWQPAVTILGTYVTGNARQWTGTAWQAIRDSVTPAPGNPQGVPFVIYGTASSNPLNAFNLQTPTAGATITTLPGSTTPVVMTWDTSTATATYKWIFGSPTVTPRRLTLPSTTNTLTTTLGALDALLASGGLAQGDSLIGQWDVWAFRNNPPANDSLKSTNGPRAITLKRGRPALSAFSLLSPPTGTRLVTDPFTTTPINILWRSAGPGASYRWKFATPSFPGTIRFNVPTALDTFLTGRTSELDSLLAGLGVTPGDSLVGQWRVYGYAGTDSLASTETFNLTFKRAAITNLFSDDFTAGAGNWTITNDGGSSGCVWQTRTTPYPNTYTLPPTSVAPVLSGDVDECGSGSSMNSTATITNAINCTHASNISLEWDNDWYTYQTSDVARVDFSTNGGTTWTQVVQWSGVDQRTTHEFFSLPSATGVAALKVRFVAIQPGWDWWWAIDNVQIKGDVTTGVDESQPGVPVEFTLSQNYPNPFNPTTTIRYQLPEQSSVSLKVFNLLGQEVKTLVNSIQNAANYQVVWDGMNARGQQVSSGIYFYQLEAKSATGNKAFTSFKKMLFIK